jgi:hypothetical protein
VRLVKRGEKLAVTRDLSGFNTSVVAIGKAISPDFSELYKPPTYFYGFFQQLLYLDERVFLLPLIEYPK